MAIEFISYSASDALDTTTVVVSRPEGAKTGDFLVAFGMGGWTNQVLIPDPPGWGIQYNHSYSGGRALLMGYRAITDINTEPLSYELPSSISATFYIMCFRGVDLSNPFAVEGQPFAVGGTSSNSTTTITGITTTEDNAMLVALGVYHTVMSTVPSITGMEPAGLHTGSRYDVPSAAGFYQLQPAAGPTGNRTITWSSGGRNGWYLTALRPAPVLDTSAEITASTFLEVNATWHALLDTSASITANSSLAADTVTEAPAEAALVASASLALDTISEAKAAATLDAESTMVASERMIRHVDTASELWSHSSVEAQAIASYHINVKAELEAMSALTAWAGYLLPGVEVGGMMRSRPEPPIAARRDRDSAPVAMLRSHPDAPIAALRARQIPGVNVARKRGRNA